jgi:hypothetical protein
MTKDNALALCSHAKACFGDQVTTDVTETRFFGRSEWQAVLTHKKLNRRLVLNKDDWQAVQAAWSSALEVLHA